MRPLRLNVQTRYSKNDHTKPYGYGTGEPNPIYALAEAGADVKSPEDGRVYSVLTIEVYDTQPGVQFSDFAATPSNGLASFYTAASAPRQVVLVQVTDSMTQQILWQRFFYGLAQGTNPIPVATNARAVAVYPAALDGSGNRSDTRVVISGETYDSILPASQAPNGNPGASSVHPSGFLAVYDGEGNLLWTHHFFGKSHPGGCRLPGWLPGVASHRVRAVDPRCER